MDEAVVGDFNAARRHQASVLAEPISQHPEAKLLGLEVCGEHVNDDSVEQAHGHLPASAEVSASDAASSP